MRRTGALLAIVLSIGCSRPAEIRLAGSSIATSMDADRKLHAKYSFDLQMPTHGRNYQLQEFALIDRAGRTHMPTQLQMTHSSDAPDTAKVTFETDDSSDPAELRVGEWRKELHIRSSHR